MNFIIIPVKSAKFAKLRLAPILDTKQRKNLCINMYKDVIKAVDETKTENKLLTISSDPSILRIGRKFGDIITENTQSEINSSINVAISRALENHAESVLIIPADIPLILSNDIDEIFKYKIKAPTMIITPSIRKNGTNLLYLAPPDIVEIQYGENSFQKHLEKASKIENLNLIIHKSENISLDIDLPEDLKLFLKLTSQTLTYQYLEKLDLKIS
ncbi:MAG: 2-phospho-L-lactate guanylyltransferase [Candidatus Helarchaeota archaeon]